MSATGPRAIPGKAAQPSAEVRSLISLLLFFHLFAVAIALAAYVSPSALEQRLRSVLGMYTGTLYFDLKPNVYPTGRFYLTHELEGDVDFAIEVSGVLSDGTQQSEKIPLAGLWPGERRRHWQALANASGAMLEDDDLAAKLPLAIAGSILKQWGARRGTVRVVAHLLLSFEDVESSDPGRADPFERRHYRTVYEADVLVGRDGQVDLVKKSPAGEVAPVDKGS